MRARPPSTARGFTLVELLIALVVATFAVAGALALLVGQQRIFQTSSGDRAVQEAARVALDDIASNLRLAGYGLEPSFAFDFGRLASVPADRLPPGQAASVAGYTCPADVTCRDSQAGPDELVFHYRSPYFARPLVARGADSLTVAGPLTAPLEPGQILLVACYSGDMYWATVTVARHVDATAAGSFVVDLLSGVGREFGRQNAVLASDACFGAVAPAGTAVSAAAATTATKVFKIERFRYFIRSYAADGSEVAWRTAGSRPYLMLDRGLQVDGAAVAQVVAPDVEDLQVSYTFPRAPAGTQLVGVALNVPVANDAAGIDLAAATPTYSDRLNAPVRATHHPANIGAVGVAVVVRTPEPDARLVSPDMATIPASWNRDAVPNAPTGFRRSRFDTTILTPNLDVRAPYFPTYSDNPADRLNVNGG